MDVDTKEAWSHALDRTENDAFPIDLSDEEWAQIALMIPQLAQRRRNPDVEVCKVLNAFRCT